MTTAPDLDPDGLAGHPDVAELLPRCTFDTDRPRTAALSGGADSTAMLVLAVAAGCDVRAVHVDHGLRYGSDRDATIAAVTARRLGVGCEVVRAELADGPNLEARARDARRAALGPDVMTGHTADDQAETVVLALLRGAGATGLAAMRPGPDHPILRLRRAETVRLCEVLGLDVAEDPTNTDGRFRRNRIRHELLPLADRIAERDVAPLLVRTSDLLRDDDELLDQLAAELDPTDARGLSAAHPALARRAIRRWLTDDDYPPDAATVARVIEVATGNAAACDVGRGRSVRRSEQRLVLSAQSRPGG